MWRAAVHPLGKIGRGFLLASLLASLPTSGFANEPCSGRKGGMPPAKAIRLSKRRIGQRKQEVLYCIHGVDFVRSGSRNEPES